MVYNIKYIYAIVFALLLSLGISCNSFATNPNGFNVTVAITDIKPHVTVLYLAIEHNPNIDTSLPHNIIIRSNNTNKTIISNPISIRSYNNLFTYQAELPNILIPELIEDIQQTIKSKKDKATQEYNDFEERMSYEVSKRWVNNEPMIQESYAEMKRLQEKETKLRNAIDNIEISYNTICKRHITISIEPSATNVEVYGSKP